MSGTSGIKWMERLKGFLLLVPPVCLMLLTAPTRIVLGCLLMAKLHDEYFTVISAHDGPTAPLPLIPSVGVSPKSRWSFERVLSAALGCALFVAAHWGVTALLATTIFSAMTIIFAGLAHAAYVTRAVSLPPVPSPVLNTPNSTASAPAAAASSQPRPKPQPCSGPTSLPLSPHAAALACAGIWQSAQRALQLLCWLSLPFAHAGLLHAASAHAEGGLLLLLAPAIAVVAGENAGLVVGALVSASASVPASIASPTPVPAPPAPAPNMGATKPFPFLSPGKTAAGYSAQIVAGTIAGAIMAGYIVPTLSVTSSTASASAPTAFSPFTVAAAGGVVGTVVGVVGAAGDLVESFFKRSHQTKDAGSWLPGWGGLLDRLDGVVVAFPIVYYALTALAPHAFVAAGSEMVA